MGESYFVAIPIPQEICGMVSHLFCGLPHARWVDWHQLHLTLRFLGPLDGATLWDIKEFLPTLTIPTFELRLLGVGLFSAKRAGRHVLWVGCASPPELLALQGKIENGVRALGLPAERRNYSPHITLARIEGDSDARLADYLQAFSHFATPPFKVDRMVLYRSEQRREGMAYIEESVIQTS